MSQDEAINFENDSDFSNILLMRKCDEKAKVPKLDIDFKLNNFE